MFTIFPEPASQDSTKTCSLAKDLRIQYHPFYCLLVAAFGFWLTLVGSPPAVAQTNFTVLKLFSLPEGAVPKGTLADGKDGSFYGVTAAGGTSNMGTVFSLKTDGSRYTTLKSFVGTDGTSPYSGMVVSTNGTLFGTTYLGGLSNFGTVFKINKNGTGFQVLHHFTGASDSKTPSGALIEGNDGAMYGMTSFGDASTRGTIYKINQDGTGYAIIHTFTGTPDGQQPQGRLLQTSDGTIYGTTIFGGSASQPGVIFSLNNDGGSYSVLHTFGGAGDGRGPACGLSEGSDGALYGTTAHGGTATVGTLFKMDKGGGGYSVLRSFLNMGGDGQLPNTELVEGTDGKLHGTTSAGGVKGGGTLFTVAKDGSGYAILIQFGSGAADLTTAGGLLLGTNHAFYGTTQYGGGNDNTAGCAYVLTPAPLPPRILSLSVSDGSNSIQCATTSSIQYDVQRSTNLSSWSVLTTLTSALNGQLPYTDPTPPKPAAFYRLQQR